MLRIVEGGFKKIPESKVGVPGEVFSAESKTPHNGRGDGGLKYKLFCFKFCLAVSGNRIADHFF